MYKNYTILQKNLVGFFMMTNQLLKLLGVLIYINLYESDYQWINQSLYGTKASPHDQDLGLASIGGELRWNALGDLTLASGYSAPGRKGKL